MMRDHGATCCAFCHEVNMPITASTEACCAGTDASLALALPSIAETGAALMTEPDAARLAVDCASDGRPSGFAACAGSLRYETAWGSLAPSQRRSTNGRCGAVEELVS